MREQRQQQREQMQRQPQGNWSGMGGPSRSDVAEANQRARFEAWLRAPRLTDTLGHGGNWCS